jgi:hypothetical protein
MEVVHYIPIFPDVLVFLYRDFLGRMLSTLLAVPDNPEEGCLNLLRCQMKF